MKARPWLIALACSVSPMVLAQQPVFRSNIDAVRVDVSVMNGVRPVAGLTAANFTLTDGGVPQTIDRVEVDTVPLNIMLVLDTSGSMFGERLKDLIAASRRLIETLKPSDAAALMTFNEPAELLVPMTHDRQPLLARIDALKAEGATSLYDGLFLALQMRPETTEARSVALVFSDGRDTASWLSRASVTEAVRRSGVVTHIVELTAQSLPLPRMRFGGLSSVLAGLADAGGGRRWHAASSSDLQELFARVLEELRSRYLLTYSPTGVAREGWHDVKVSLKGARGDVIARPGYFVGPQ
jgi:Ca-activated chloride channel family protein